VRITYAVGDEPVSPVAGDFNNDGAIDILTSEAAGGSISVILGVAEQRTSAPYLYLMDQEGALESLEIINNTSRRVSAELGNIGAAQSRLAHTVNYLQQIRENYLTAKSQIEDADVALEAAELVRNQILQQAAAAVLAQANQQSSIALLLLGEGI
jgi:flagellin